MKKEELKFTDIWKEYQRGVNYNRSRNLYKETEQQYNFYHGNQWEGLQSGNIQPIVYNIIKPTIKYKLGYLKTNEYQIVFNPNEWENFEQMNTIEQICKMLNSYANRIWEKEKVKAKIDEAVKDCSITGEGIIHSYEEDGDIKCEVIDKQNIYYGNENEDNIQEQPYIILSYRRPVEDVKKEAEKNGVKKEELEKICADQQTQEQANSKLRDEELTPMCIVLTKYFKKDGIVYYEKSTQTVKIEKATSTGLTLYPVAHMLWEKIKGSSRGQGEVKYMIPNQIELNKTVTRRAISTMMSAYPKLVANIKYISDTSALNKVGTTIEVDQMQADDINKVVNYLKPASMSGDAFNLQQDLIDNTQNLAGAGDNANGNINPEQASGTAILAVQKANQQPLNEQLELYKQFVEDIALIWFEMIKTYKTEGLTLVDEKTDTLTGAVTETPIEITQQQLDNLKIHIKIDITPRSAYDKYAQERSLENLLGANHITFKEYINLLDDDATMPKPKLEKLLKQRQEEEQQMYNMQKQANILNNAMQEVMTGEEQRLGGEANEMSTMQASRNANYGGEGQAVNTQM